MLPPDRNPVFLFVQQLSKSDYSIVEKEHRTEAGSGQPPTWRFPARFGQSVAGWFTRLNPSPTNRSRHPEYIGDVYWLDAGGETRSSALVYRPRQRAGKEELEFYDPALALEPWTSGLPEKPVGNGPWPFVRVLAEDDTGLVWAGTLSFDQVEQQFGTGLAETIRAADLRHRTRRVVLVWPEDRPDAAEAGRGPEARDGQQGPRRRSPFAELNRRVASRRATSTGGGSAARPAGPRTPSAQTLYIRPRLLRDPETFGVVDQHFLIKVGQASDLRARESGSFTDVAPMDIRGRYVDYSVTESREFPPMLINGLTQEAAFFRYIEQFGFFRILGLGGQTEFVAKTTVGGGVVGHDASPEAKQEALRELEGLLHQFHQRWVGGRG